MNLVISEAHAGLHPQQSPASRREQGGCSRWSDQGDLGYDGWGIARTRELIWKETMV